MVYQADRLCDQLLVREHGKKIVPPLIGTAAYCHGMGALALPLTRRPIRL